MRRKIILYIIVAILLLTSCRLQNEKGSLERDDKNTNIEAKNNDNDPIEIESDGKTDQEDSKTNEFEFSSGAFTKKDIHQLFKMNRKEMIYIQRHR